MSKISSVIEVISKQLPEIEYRRDEALKNHTSFRIGGPVAAMFFPKSQNETADLYAALRELNIRTLILGNGTNILAADEPLDLVVIKTYNGLSDIRLIGDTEIYAQSGVLLTKLAVFALENGLSGLEFAHGIPGTLGGAVSMNAGAYGGEMKHVVTKTTALTPNAAIYEAVGDAQAFEYRHSRFSDSDDVILASVLQLVKKDCAEIKSKMDAFSEKRRAAQPLNYPSAGSTFKRPKGGYAASLIEQAGLKGYTIGGAMVSEHHSGFIINRGDATFNDVCAVMEAVRQRVQTQFGIELEPEVKIIQ